MKKSRQPIIAEIINYDENGKIKKVRKYRSEENFAQSLLFEIENTSIDKFKTIVYSEPDHYKNLVEWYNRYV